MGGTARRSRSFVSRRRREGPPPCNAGGPGGGHSAVPSGRRSAQRISAGLRPGGGIELPPGEPRALPPPARSRQRGSRITARSAPHTAPRGRVPHRPAPRVFALGAARGRVRVTIAGPVSAARRGGGRGGARRPLPGSRWAFSSPARGKEIMKRPERGAARRRGSGR